MTVSSLTMMHLTVASSDPTDRDLIDRTIEGDGHAYGVLVSRFQRKIFRVAYAVVRDATEADTIVQDTFVQAYMNLSKFEGRSELETWLTRIAINKSRDSLRRRKFVSLFTGSSDDDERHEMVELIDQRPDAEREMASAQLRTAIARAELTLSSQQKVVFRLRHYENMSLEEIAVQLGLRSGTVRAHLFRAVHKVRHELASWRYGKGNDHESTLG